jgi:glutamine amidotransferase
MIAIVDYNMGNLRSVQNAFDKIGANAVIEKDPDRLKDYDKLVLPGVGAFGDAMEHLKKSALDEALIDYANSGKPFLGVCLGMQLLFNSSSEFGSHKGLGLIDGEVELFDKSRFKTPLKVPHMGWNEIETSSSILFKGLDKKFYLYFVHSYHVKTDERFIIGKTHYGYDFASAVQKDNIFGFQPHPEKSHENGLKILKNFTDI